MLVNKAFGGIFEKSQKNFKIFEKNAWQDISIMILYTSRFGTDLMDSTWGTYKTHHFLSGAKINFENLKKVLDKQNWLWYYIKADSRSWWKSAMMWIGYCTGFLLKEWRRNSVKGQARCSLKTEQCILYIVHHVQLCNARWFGNREND